MRLTITKTKNCTFYYVIETYHDKNGTNTSRVIEKLGKESDLKKKYGADFDVEAWARKHVEDLNRKIKENKPVPIQLMIEPNVSYDKEISRSFNVGYLFLQKELYGLAFKKLIKQIKEHYRFQYDFEKIFADLIYSRVLEPCSKLSSFEYCKEHLLESPNYKLHDVYRSLDVISQQMDLIQEFFYKESNLASKRNTSVLFYDCTNFYFEIGQEDEIRKYGRSKEHRPNPLVEFGLFMDGDGIPLGFDLFPGNQNEQTTMKSLEERILKDYGLYGAKLIVCTDAGLASASNRKFNSFNRREFITIQPIKTMSKVEQDWVLNPGRSLCLEPLKTDENQKLVERDLRLNNWREAGSQRLISLLDIDEDDPVNLNKIFYKEKRLVDEKTKLEQRLIVTYSIKYKRFMQKKRERDLLRAQKLIKLNNGKKIEINANNDVRRYIKTERTTGDGQIIENVSYSLDGEEIANQASYDGFYAVCTSISQDECSIEEIIRINKGRWEIEESFMLMKSEFRSRPVYVRLQDRIRAHFTVCFVALLLFRLLERKIQKMAPTPISAHALIQTLRQVNVAKIDKHYTGSFKRTDITDLLHQNAEMRFDCELITDQQLNKCIKLSKK